MPPQQPPNKTQTIEITNFGGRLTRILNGDLNSGFAKFVTSFGYDPFSKPMNLTWLEAPVDITGPTSGGLMVAAKPRTEGITQYIYAINSAGNMYKIQPASVFAGSPNVDSVVSMGSVTAGSPTYLYGSSMDFYGATEKIFVTNDQGLHNINFDFSAESVLGAAGNFASNTFHPVKKFSGKLLFGNGNTIAAVDSTGTITSSVIGTGQGALYSELNPPLPVDVYVRDLDVSIDGNYALLTASGINSEQILTPIDDAASGASSDGYIYYWNGSDQTVTSFNSIPSYAVASLQTYLNQNTFFSSDAFGTAVNDGTQKILTLPNNKPPLPNATLVNGNFVSWICPELSNDGTTINSSLYYFGALDQENPPGLYRVMRMGPSLASGFVYQTPLNILTSNKYTFVNSGKTAVVVGSYGKHYFSTMEISSSNTQYKLYRFLITSSGSGTPQLGVYETQTQLFSKRITVKQIRVYTEPTASGNGFQVDCIGGDGNVITNSGVTTYTFTAGSDPTKLQGSLQRIDFNPVMQDTYALGLRITNTGTTNMTIRKIEVDWMPSGK